MKSIKQKHLIKIPKKIITVYCEKKKIITFISSSQIKSIKLQVKIVLLNKINSILICNQCHFKASPKIIKQLQGTAIAKIKQILIEINYPLFHKLKFIGVGYRAFPVENMQNQLYFKLGYSHLIYFKLPPVIKSKCLKNTQLFLFGNCSYELLTQTAASLRNCKSPEPYKGKGILYNNEIIKLKKGKKI